MIFNAIIYKIRITRLDVIGTIIAFLGLSVVINPAMFSFSGEELKIESERFVYAEGLERYLCILFLFSACTTWAYSTIMVRQMRGEISTI
jgi:drug/metabolite transporter (DMT)-like permease